MRRLEKSSNGVMAWLFRGKRINTEAKEGANAPSLRRAYARAMSRVHSMRNSDSRSPANFIESKRFPVKKTPTISATTASAVRHPKRSNEAAINLSRLPGCGLLLTKIAQCFMKKPLATPTPSRASAIKLTLPFRKMDNVRNKHMQATSSKAVRN